MSFSSKTTKKYLCLSEKMTCQQGCQLGIEEHSFSDFDFYSFENDPDIYFHPLLFNHISEWVSYMENPSKELLIRIFPNGVDTPLKTKECRSDFHAEYITAFHHACEHIKLDMMTSLLSLGANPEIKIQGLLPFEIFVMGITNYQQSLQFLEKGIEVFEKFTTVTLTKKWMIDYLGEDVATWICESSKIQFLLKTKREGEFENERQNKKVKI